MLPKNSKNSSSIKKIKMAEDLSLLSDEANYRDTLQAYLKYMEQLPPQKLWMKEELGPRIK